MAEINLDIVPDTQLYSVDTIRALFAERFYS